MMKRWLRHNDQLEIFSDKIFNYNLMLIVIVAFVCSTYVMLNIRIIDKFNDTYVSYNDLNGFYFHVKEMNDNFQVYLYCTFRINGAPFPRQRCKRLAPAVRYPFVVTC